MAGAEGGVPVYTNAEAQRYQRAMKVQRNSGNSNAYIRNVVQKRPKHSAGVGAGPLGPVPERYSYFTNPRPTAERRMLTYAVRVGDGWESRSIDLAAVIEENARRFDVDPVLVELVIKHESAFNPRAVSRSGAQGLMQLIPGTAAMMGVGDPWDPEQNVRGGTEYLSLQLRRFRDVGLALAAYNAGPNSVVKHGGVPPFAETQGYVARITREYEAVKKRQKQARPTASRGGERQP